MAKHLITSALPYINGIKHLGNLIGSLLPADVFARFCRQQGDEVLFICGTDEHGTPAEIAALDAGMSVAEFCKKMHATQLGIYKEFDLSFDHFGRSSSAENHILTHDIFHQLYEGGYIIEKSTLQMYSNTDKRFLPDRYVIGECPHCGYGKARGDQCDGCGKLLDPTELINPLSSISMSADMEAKEAKHLFLDLPKCVDKVEKWVDAHPHWPAVTKGVAKKWLTEGLQPRCISRDLEWGVNIPLPGFEDKVFYVWFDAPIAYISMTMAWANENGQHWKDWWQNPDVRYTQFMAKDNLAFHTIFWPAMMLNTNEPWHMADDIKGFNWLTYEGGKFSTSQQRGVFTDQALALFPSDYWRYYLMANAPESSDADFSFADFANTINKDLADTLGNFFSRVCALVKKYMNCTLEHASEFPETLRTSCEALLHDMVSHMQQQKIRAYMTSLRALWALGNEYITEQAPWHLIKEDEHAGKHVLMNCMALLRTFAIASAPVMPKAATHIFEHIGETVQPDVIALEKALWTSFSIGQEITPPAPLFTKVSAEQVAELTEKYAGTLESD